jgi:hypothetical protein
MHKAKRNELRRIDPELKVKAITECAVIYSYPYLGFLYRGAFLLLPIGILLLLIRGWLLGLRMKMDGGFFLVQLIYEFFWILAFMIILCVIQCTLFSCESLSTLAAKVWDLPICHLLFLFFFSISLWR